MQRTNDTHDVGYDDEPLYVNFIQYFYMINNRQIGKNIQANKQNFHMWCMVGFLVKILSLQIHNFCYSGESGAFLKIGSCFFKKVFTTSIETKCFNCC